MSPQTYAIAADLVLAVHVALVVFVLAVPLLLPLGHPRGWRWTRRRGVRIAHLVVLGVVVLEAWLGVLCPLTHWEMQLRAAAGGVTYEGDFIAHWLGRVLYVEAPAWVFTLVYSAFFALVVAVHRRYPVAGALHEPHGR